ncbi:MAG: glycosyltransferase family 4 protein [Candidatus Woesearchaeota archaeon]
MNILILSEYFPETTSSDITGGVESRAFYLAKELSKKHSVYILTSWRNNLERKTEFKFIDKNKKIKHSFLVYRVGDHHPYSNNAGFLSRLNFACALVNQAKSFKNIDIIDAYNFTTYLPGYKIARKLKKKIIATYHETWINEWIKNKGIIALPYEVYERLILKLNFDAFISVSNFTKKRLIQNGVNEHKIKVISNGIDLEKFNLINKNQIKKEKRPTIIYVGRLIKTKKVDILIKSISLLKKEIPDIKLKIIGQGQELNNLKKLSSNLNLEKNISFLGFLKSHEEVLNEIKKSHVFCSPSNVEGFGIVLLEAIALKIPFVCTEIPPFIEITNKRGGLFFKPDNYLDLSKKLKQLLTDKILYKEKIKELDYIKDYDWEKIAKEVESFYKKVINS